MAIVNIWYPKPKSRRQIKQHGIGNNPQSHPVYDFVENVGHASLTLDDTIPQNYVSWWPDAQHQSFATPSYAQDLELEGEAPSAQVSLDMLREDHIASWWDRVKLDGLPIPWRLKFHPADSKWTLDRSNCSHLVLLALEVGGASEHAQIFRWNATMVTPPQIHFYALRLKAAAALNRMF